MSQITKRSGVFHIPNHITIPYIIGDKSQVNILDSVHRIIDSAVSMAYRNRKKIDWQEIRCSGPCLAEDEIELFESCVVGMRYPFWDPEACKVVFPAQDLIRELDLHTCFQHIRHLKGLTSSIKKPEDLNLFMITGGSEHAYDYIENEYAKVMRSSLRLAVNRGLPSITIVHSQNINHTMERAFRVWGYEITDKEFTDQTFSMNVYHSLLKLWGKAIADEELAKAKAEGKVIVRDESIEAFLHGVSENPRDYSVIVALQSCGEYISDELTRMTGASGFIPRAYYNYINGHALFESVYMDYLNAEQNGLVSLIPTLLSGVMLLDYIGWTEAENLILDVLRNNCLPKNEITKKMSRSEQLLGSTVRGLVR